MNCSKIIGKNKTQADLSCNLFLEEVKCESFAYLETLKLDDWKNSIRMRRFRSHIIIIQVNNNEEKSEFSSIFQDLVWSKFKVIFFKWTSISEWTTKN